MENKFDKNCYMSHNYENLKKFEIYSNELHKLFVNSEIKQYPSCIQNHSDAISRYELKEILKEVLKEKLKEALKEDFNKIYKRFDNLEKRFDDRETEIFIKKYPQRMINITNCYNEPNITISKPLEGFSTESFLGVPTEANSYERF